jgi:hypothetical protein
MSTRPPGDDPATALDADALRAIGNAHRRRLREVWRSAGWPCQDVIEAELLAAGLLERQHDGQQRMTLRVSDRGLQLLAQTAERNRGARSAHERLVAAVAAALAQDGRIAWCGLSLRARVGESGQERWQMARPDVYSVRHTSVAAYLQPVVHEIKVRRADLLADLRRPVKRQAYLQMAGALYYVLAEGIGEPDEVPAECGVLLARTGPDARLTDAPGEPAPDDAPPVRLEVLRPAPTRALEQHAGLPFAVWMALARATPVAQPGDPQLWLGA